MPLTRDKMVGYDGARMVFRFTMLNKGETVECEISVRIFAKHIRR